MELCVMIEGQEGVTWDDWLALARACEDGGFTGLFRSDHYLSFSHPSERGALDAWTTIAALGAVTERIRLGSLVSPVTFRHPALLAKSVVTADHASRGRVEVGMGAGWFDREHEAFGFAFPPIGERMDLLTEQVEIVHRLLGDEEDVTFDGAHYRLEACPTVPRPAQAPHPPLIMGGDAGPRSAALAARWADEYDTVYADPPGAKERMDRVAAACDAIGRDPGGIRRSVMVRTVVGEDERELRRRAGELMAWEGEDGDVDAYVADLRASHVAGTVEEVLERLAAFAAVGIQRVYLQHLVHRDVEAVALLGREVVPHVTGL